MKKLFVFYLLSFNLICQINPVYADSIANHSKKCAEQSNIPCNFKFNGTSKDSTGILVYHEYDILCLNSDDFKKAFYLLSYCSCSPKANGFRIKGSCIED